jgi:hypothetical protein
MGRRTLQAINLIKPIQGMYMAISVNITLSDEGVMSVKEVEPSQEMGGEAGQEVQTLDEAFTLAEEILLGEGGAPKEVEEQAFSAGMGNMMGGDDPAAKGGM